MAEGVIIVERRYFQAPLLTPALIVGRTNDMKKPTSLNFQLTRKPSSSNLQLASDMLSIIKRLNRRMGGRKNKGCDELDGNCFDCQTRILIAYLN